jgi:SecD/SecF fusion protein
VSDRRSHLVLVGLILALLAGVVALGVPGSPVHKKVTLGLDLQGGLELVLKAVPPRGQKVTPGGMDVAQSVIRNLIDSLGVTEPELRRQGTDQIVIELAGVRNPEAARRLIGTTAQLEMYDLEPNLIAGPQTSLYGLLAGVQPQAKKGTPVQWYVFDAKKRVVAGPQATQQGVLSGKRIKKLLGASNRLPKGYKLLAVPDKSIVLTCGTSAVVCPGVQQAPPTSTSYYLFKHDPKAKSSAGVVGVPEMTGRDLKLSGTRQDFDTSNGNQPVVLLQFTGKGSHKFQAITKAEYIRGQLRNSPQHFAIVLDRQIRSFPQIDYTDSSLSSGISGNAQITGLKDLQEAKNLALVLRSGALPYNFRQLEQTNVSATLGKDSLNEAKRAALYGLLVVAIFLLLLYRFLGLVAVIGLAIYAAFLYAAILLFHVTLTLPGFAGLILTIGVAADANVVIFERIKEEVRAGKSMRAAISAGYAKGFHTIIDANVVTAITALVLFAVATAGVKGFALMLLIGTIISLLTAVAATRAMLGLLGGFRWFNNASFMGATGEQGLKWLQIDFMRRRYLWFAISGVIVLVSAISLGLQGLNFGIDFKGGSQLTFKTAQPHQTDDVRAVAALVNRPDAVVQGRGKTVNGGYTSWQMRTKVLSPTAQNTLKNDLQNRIGARAFGINTVSASFSSQVARLAIWAVVVSLLLIVLYIAFRFDLKYAGPVIVALLHDIVITVGVYSLTQREVTTSTVAAVLTVLGYSIYDTIIIFDRIRENTHLMRRQAYATIANVSLWETIRRSLATTFITLLPVASLLVFGGATLKDFAFALLVGITSGAYSSIFIAAPMLTILKEREPEYARRKSLDGRVTDPDAVLEAAEAAAAAEPSPAEPVGAVQRAATDVAKRERRRQRRRARPHGRAR